MPLTIENPRFLPGSISGANMERTPEGRVVHTNNAIVLDSLDVCLVEHPNPGNPMFAMVLAGAIGTGPDRATCLTLFSPEGAGLMIDRIIGMAGVLGPEFVHRLLSRVQQLNPVDPEPDPDLHTEPPLDPQTARPEEADTGADEDLPSEDRQVA